MKRFFAILFIASTIQCLAQSEQEKLAAIEQARANEKQRLVLQTLDSAVMLMGLGSYEAADKKFRHVLKNTRSVSSDLTYYFGENSYHMGLNKQSVDWLNKYLQLKGTKGRFSDDAVMYLKQAEAALLEEKSQQAKQATIILSRDFDVDCGPTGKVICPVCSGSTVIIKKSYLGETYKTCAYCHKSGFLTCEEYNKLLRGQLKPENN